MASTDDRARVAVWLSLRAGPVRTSRRPVWASDPKGPQPGRETKRDPAGPASGSAPLLAIVSLNDQRVTVYDANGRKMLQSPVSTGSTNYETPVGIYSVVQKKEQHQSNQYEDGNMPFMQRITWTGIALHAGVLPGHPASHGCVRLPIAFAERLFGLTDIGLRVIVVRDDMAPGEIAHPALFKPSLTRREAALSPPRQRARERAGHRAGSRAAAGIAEACRVPQSEGGSPSPPKRRPRARRPGCQAGRRAQGGGGGARRQGREGGRGQIRSAAREALQKAEQALTAATAAANAPAPKATARARPRSERPKQPRRRPRPGSRDAQTARERAGAKLSEADQQLAAAKEQAQARPMRKRSRATSSSGRGGARGGRRDRRGGFAADVANLGFRQPKDAAALHPQGLSPALRGPRHHPRRRQKPIGSYVFTALNHLGTSGEMRWSVVAMYPNPTNVEPPPPEPPRRVSARYPDGVQPQPPRRVTARNAEAAPTNVAAAKAAFDRIVFSQEALDVISDVVLAGSSLIISDEGPSRETGKDTDFVVVMSGEPQGALKIRQREPMPMDEFGFGRSPFRGFPFWN